MKKVLVFVLIIYVLFILSLSVDAQSSRKTFAASKAITTQISVLTKDSSTFRATVSKVNYIIRKGAHFFIYCFFAVILSLVAINFKFSLPRAWGYILFISLFIANVDELIQRYVGGRSSQVKDCLIDLTGAAVGMMATFFIYTFMNKIRHNLDSKQ
ncbi:VanZ family protein [Clostridium sp.]|uniref:VanZ family protein n=1 Tax=Clostridium sp. TaxID=1506 RepID=UPI002FC83C58